MKKCACGETDITKFSKHKNTKDGLQKSCKICCKICKKPETMRFKGVLKSLVIDHDHKNGKVRGLLCSNYNRGLGYFKDSVKLFKSAIEYLEKRSKT